VGADSVTRVRFSANNSRLIVTTQDAYFHTSLRVFAFPSQNVVPAVLSRLTAGKAEDCGRDSLCLRVLEVLRRVAAWKALTLSGEPAVALADLKRDPDAAQELGINPESQTSLLVEDTRAELARADLLGGITEAEILARAGRTEEAQDLLQHV